MKNSNETQLLTYLQSLVISTQSLIDSKKQSIELYENDNFSPRPPKDIIDGVKESINPLIFRLKWLESQINQISELK